MIWLALPGFHMTLGNVFHLPSVFVHKGNVALPKPCSCDTVLHPDMNQYHTATNDMSNDIFPCDSNYVIVQRVDPCTTH